MAYKNDFMSIIAFNVRLKDVELLPLVLLPEANFMSLIVEAPRVEIILSELAKNLK